VTQLRIKQKKRKQKKEAGGAASVQIIFTMDQKWENKDKFAS